MFQVWHAPIMGLLTCAHPLCPCRWLGIAFELPRDTEHTFDTGRDAVRDGVAVVSGLINAETVTMREMITVSEVLGINLCAMVREVAAQLDR